MANCIKCGAELMPGAVYCHACGKNRWLKREKAGHDQTVQEMPTKEERHGQPVQLDIPTQRRKRTVAIGSFANGPQRAASRQKQKP